MIKKISSLKEVLKLHEAGHFKLAKKGYLSILKNNPKDIATLDALGMLYAQENKCHEAVQCFKKSLTYDPTNPILALHLATTLKIFKLYEEAKKVLDQLLMEQPNYAPAHNNLGSVYFSEGQLDLAKTHYQQAISLSEDYVDAYYNLGLTLLKQNKSGEAIQTFEKLLHYAPHYDAARFHLGCLLQEKNNISDAIKHFQIIENKKPNHVETQINLATCFLKKGFLEEAKKHYHNALLLTPNDSQILFNLGVISAEQGELDQAIRYYQQGIQIDPNNFALHNNIAILFLAKQHVHFAFEHFKKALEIQPGNQSIQFLIHSLSKKNNLLTAPPEYIKTLFNSYAEHYESHLLNTLEYQIPTLFYEIMQKLKLSDNLKILDLGCGTGLCGEKFKSKANSLIGVDLSENMIKMAAKKNIYDSLENQDIAVFLSEKKEEYQLILAADTLVYMGDLENIFRLAYQSLKTTGFFIFNTEISEEKYYQINQSGRFSHQKKYLDHLAKIHQFKVVVYQTSKTRIQNSSPLFGHIYVLQKCLPSKSSI